MLFFEQFLHHLSRSWGKLLLWITVPRIPHIHPGILGVVVQNGTFPFFWSPSAPIFLPVAEAVLLLTLADKTTGGSKQKNFKLPVAVEGDRIFFPGDQEIWRTGLFAQIGEGLALDLLLRVHLPGCFVLFLITFHNKEPIPIGWSEHTLSSPVFPLPVLGRQHCTFPS